MVRLCRLKSRSDTGNTTSRHEYTAPASECLQFSKRARRDAFHVRQNHHLVPIGPQYQRSFLHATDLIERIIIEEVEIVSSLEDCGHDVGAEMFAQRLDHVHFSGGETGPGVAVRQVEGHVVGGSALPHEETHPLQVERHVRHHDPPRVLLVVDARRIKTPARIVDTFRRVGPAVTDQLVDALQEVQVCFGFDVQWRCAKDG